jgi:membrane-associated protease RseP (regulator of RpoE activity)
MFCQHARLWRSTVIALGLVWMAIANPARAFQDEKPAAQAPKPPTGGFQGQPGFGGFGQQRGAQFGFSPFMAHPRLGVGINRPSETLVEQLNLPQGHALVVENVVPDSPAAKAGIKAHDILLKVEDKPIPGEPAEFSQMLGELKADHPITIVLMRKGKEETIKDIKLPEQTAAQQPVFRGRRAGAFQPPDKFQPPSLGGPSRGGVSTTLMRTNDQFNAHHQEGMLSINVTGKVDDGKVKLTSITVQDKNKRNTYDSVDKVPEEYKSKVNSLVDLAKAGNIKAEIQALEKDAEPKKK